MNTIHDISPGEFLTWLAFFNLHPASSVLAV